MKISNFKFQISNSQGFSIIEIVLAAAIFMLFSTAAVVVVLGGLNANRLGSEETIASQFATEGIEAVKSIKNQAYTNLITPNPTPRAVLRNASNVWEFGSDGSNNTLTHNVSDNYIRQVKVESINRDACGNIVEAPAGTQDQDSKKITSTVNWNFNVARPESVVLTTYLTDWRKSIEGMGPIMMAYSKTTNTPYYRIWDGCNWSSEAAAQTVGGNIDYIVLKSSRTRNEAILGTLDSLGNIYAQVWNGNSWGTPLLLAALGTTLADYRSFDIEYEKNNDRAMIVYLPNSTSFDPEYRYWDGISWSLPAAISAPPTTGVVRWIELAPKPISTSNEIAMIMLDSNIDIYGMAWDGTNWNTMGVSGVWDATAATSDKKSIDVSYEQILGRAMFIWGDSTRTDQYYRIWDGSSLTAVTLLDIPASGDIAEWLRLVSRPNSNELMYGVQDARANLNTRKWSGSSWDTATQHPEHDSSTEDKRSMNFDVVWETYLANSGKAWVMWGDGVSVSKKQWSGSAWEASSTLTGSGRASFIKFNAALGSGVVFAGIYESINSGTKDIWETRLTSGGTAWSAKNTIWDGGASADPVFFRIDMAVP